MKKNNSKVYWILGIPGSGKTTLARHIREQMRKLKITCALLDDEVWMHLSKKNRVKMLRMMRKDYQITVVTSVVPPSKNLDIDRLFILQEDEKTAKKRHYTKERFGDAKDPQWFEYERYWKPWQKVAEGTPIHAKKTEERYQYIYDFDLSDYLARTR